MTPLDQTIHIVTCAFKGTEYVREREVWQTSRYWVVNDMVGGEFEYVLRIWAFNSVEGWAHDVTEDIARTVAERVQRNIERFGAENVTLPKGLLTFLEHHLGLKNEMHECQVAA